MADASGVDVWVNNIFNYYNKITNLYFSNILRVLDKLI